MKILKTFDNFSHRLDLVSLKYFLRYFLIIGFYFLFSHPVKSQPNSVFIGSNGFNSITAAYSSIGTLTNAVLIEIQSNYTGLNETFPINLTSKSGASSSNTITIRPVLSVTSVSIQVNSNTVIYVNGAKYLIVDGRPGGSGTSKALIIKQTDVTGYYCAVKFSNGAGNNIIRFCDLQGENLPYDPVNYKGSGVVGFFSSSSAIGNNNNTIETCDIHDPGTGNFPAYGVFGFGASGKENTGNLITYCNIYNFYNSTADATGVYVYSNNKSWTISFNSFYQSIVHSGIDGHILYGIYIKNGSDSFNVNDNYIGGTAPDCSGSPLTLSAYNGYSFIGIRMNVSNVTSSIQHNTIRNIVWKSNLMSTDVPGVFSGIYVDAGSVNIGNLQGNMIGDTTGTGSIIIDEQNNGIGFGIAFNSTGTSIIANNGIGSIYLTGSSTNISNSFEAIKVTNGSDVSVMNNKIGSQATSNSINADISSISSTGQEVTGIYFKKSNASTIIFTVTNNVVAHLRNGAGGTTGVSQCRGIIATDGTNTISGNTIHHLSNNTTGANIGKYSSVIGLSFFTTQSTVQLIERNSISSLSATGSGSVSVIGIYIGAGDPAYCSTNLIYDLQAPSSVNGNAVNGIYINGGSNIGIFNNSIYLDATSIGSGFGSNGIYTTTSPVIDLRNNLFVNVSAPVGAGYSVAYRRSNTTLTTYALNSNFNDFFAGAPGPDRLIFSDGTNKIQTLAAYKGFTGMSPRDSSSVTENPPFLNVVTTPYNLHINSNVLSLLESGGTVISSPIPVTTDIDGEPIFPASGYPVNPLYLALAPDIGADEFGGLGFKPSPSTPVHSVSAGGAWNSPSTWTEGFVPLSVTDVFVTNNLVTIPANAVCHNLTVNSGAYLSLTSGKSLTLNGNFHIQNNGSYIDYGTTTVGGSTTVERSMTGNWTGGTPDSSTIFHYISSPVASASSLIFLGDQIYYYSEVAHLWDLMGSTATLNPGTGYATALSSYKTKTFTGGILNHTDISLSGLTLTGSVTDYSGYHLIGNPFPCSLQWDNTWTMSNIDASAYIWDPSVSHYWLNNGITGTGPFVTGIIPPEQAFFIRANYNGGSITIPQSKRLHSSQSFMKEGAAIALHLKLTGNGSNDEALIMFNPGSTLGFDHSFDGLKLWGNDNAPEIFSVISSDQPASINVLPDLTSCPAIPVGIKTARTGIFSITASGIEDFSGNITIFLEDKKTGTVQNLKTNPVYTFSSEPQSETDTARFLLHFGTTGIAENPALPVSVYSVNKDVYINFPCHLQGTIEVFNLIREKIFQKNISGNLQNHINLDSPAGIYFIAVKSNYSNKSVKVFIH